MKAFTKNTVTAAAAFSTVLATGALLTQFGGKPAQAQQPGQSAVQGVAEDKSIRPFHVNISEEAIIDLRRRIQATRWPEKENVIASSEIFTWKGRMDLSSATPCT